MKFKNLFILCSFILFWGCSSTQAPKDTQREVPLTENQQALLDSEVWLANNLKKDGVVETQSGLQYKIIKASNGCFIDATKNVNVHYESLLPETGLVFDSSYKRGYSSIFPLNKVIVGWTEGVSTMKVGEIRELYVHPKLAYGEK